MPAFIRRACTALLFVLLPVIGRAQTASSLPSPWVDTDIGSVGVAGWATDRNSPGAFTVVGAGANIWYGSDSFNFAYQTVTGDGQVAARLIAPPNNTDAKAKAGVMIRETLATGSRHVLLSAKPDGGLELIARSTTDGSSSLLAAPAGNGHASIWLRLARSGDTITAYSSSDGLTWTTIASTTIPMGATVDVGLAVCSHTTSQTTAAMFDNVAAGAGDLAPAVVMTQGDSTVYLSAPPSVTIGADAPDYDDTPVAKVDFYANDGTANTLIGTVTASSYSYHYTLNWNNPPAGSYTLTAVATDTAGLQATSAGVSLTIKYSPGYGPLPSPWADTDIGATGINGSAAYDGGVFTVKGAGANIWYGSDSFNFVHQLMTGDGQITARVLSLTNTNAKAKAGVMIRETLATGSRHVLFNVKPGGGLEVIARSDTDGSSSLLAAPSDAAPVWLRLTRSGDTIIASSSSDGATWTTVVSTTMAMASTVEIGLVVCSHTTDMFATAQFDNVAAVASSGGTDSPPVVAITNPVAGATFALQPGIAEISMHAKASDGDATPVASVAFYANNGTTNTLLVICPGSPYSFTWMNPPAGSYTLTAVATDTAGLQTTSAGVNIVISYSSDAGALGPWADADIGTVGLAGSASYSNGVFTVNGAGANVWYDSDSFNYVYQLMSGDTRIMARVASLTNTNARGKAGVMIRETLATGSRHVLFNAKPEGGLEVIARSTTDGPSSLLAAPADTAPVWLLLIRSGNTITAYASSDGGNWRTVATTTIAMGSSVYVGLAVCSHTTDELMTATFDNVATR